MPYGLPFLDGSFNDADYVTSELMVMQLIQDWTGQLVAMTFHSSIGDFTLQDGSGTEHGQVHTVQRKASTKKRSEAGSAVGWSGFQLHSQNLHLLRFGEVLLLLAEAEIQAGSVKKG
jgi:hypothetical protein